MSRKFWSKDSIIFEIKSYHDLYGEVPRCKEWEHDPCYPSPAVVCYHFGTWKAAIEAAGYAARGRGATGHRVPVHRENGKFAKR